MCLKLIVFNIHRINRLNESAKLDQTVYFEYPYSIRIAEIVVSYVLGTIIYKCHQTQTD